MIQVMTPYAMAAFATAVKGVLLAAPGATLHLFQNNIIPTPANVLADFTEATFDGYAAHNFATLFGPDRQPDGSFDVYNFQHFQMTGNVTPNTVYGWYMTDGTGALILAERFAAPVQMQDAFSALDGRFAIGISVNGLAGTFQPA